MMGPNAALSDWINSFVQQQQQQQQQQQPNWKDVYIKTVLVTFSQNLALLRKVINFRQEPLKSESKLLLDKIRESEKQSLLLQTDFIANADLAKKINSENVWRHLVTKGPEVVQSITSTLEMAIGLRKKVDYDSKQIYDLAQVKYNVSKIHNDILREIELTKRMTYYREDYVDIRPNLDVELFSLKQSVATVNRHLGELDAKSFELNTQSGQDFEDNWKMHEHEYELLLKMAKGNTDRAALLKEREEHEDNVEWKRICSATDHVVVQQQQQQRRAEEEERVRLAEEELKNQFANEQFIRQQQEAEDRGRRKEAEERALEHAKAAAEFTRRRQEEEQRLRILQEAADSYPANVPNFDPAGAAEDGITADLIGSTN
jgi:hypothetical protein